MEDDAVKDRYATGEFANVSVEGVQSQGALAAVLVKLLADLQRDPRRWENSTLDGKTQPSTGSWMRWAR